MVGPSFPTMGGLVVTFLTFELAVRLIQVIELNPDKPSSVVVLPSIFVSSSATQHGPEQAVGTPSLYQIRLISPHTVGVSIASSPKRLLPYS